MKRSHFVCLLFIVAVAAIVSGCAKEPVGTVVNGRPVFGATTEAGMSRTSYGSGDNVGKVLWSEGDAIALFTGAETLLQYTLSSGAGSDSGVFEAVDFSGGTGSEFDRNVAYYPYDESVAYSATDNRLSVVLPSVQSYVAGGFAQGANAMVAVTGSADDHTLSFKNVVGILRLQLKGTATISSLKVEGNNGEKLSGAATIEHTFNGTPSLVMDESAAGSVTMDCGEGVVLSASTAVEFLIAVPAATYSKGITVTITDSDGTQMKKSSSAVLTVERAKIKSMAAFDYVPYGEYILFETFGTKTASSILTYVTNDGFSRNGSGVSELTIYSGSNADVRTSAVSPIASGFSGGSNMWMPASKTDCKFVVSKLSLNGETNIDISYGMTNKGAPILELSADGNNWVGVDITYHTTNEWKTVSTSITLAESPEYLYFRLNNDSKSVAARVDDIIIKKGKGGTTVTLPAAVEPTIPTIAEVLAGANGEYTTSGTVVATYTRGFLLYDQTAYILVYQGSTPAVSVAVGDVVEVTGTTSQYNLLKQFGATDLTVTKKSTTTVTHPTAQVMTASDFDSFASSPSVKYVSYDAVCSATGSSFYNFTIANSDNGAAISYPATSLVEGVAVGSTVKITGYTIGYGSSYKSVYTMALSVEVAAGYTLSVTPTDLSWESDEVDAKSSTITATGGDWSYSAANMDWATIATTATTVTVTPKAANTSSSANSGTITITCGDKTATINATQNRPAEAAVQITDAYVGFESSEGFTASSTYNNTTVAYTGAEGKQWGTYYGTPSTSSNLSGSQSMQMRWYPTAVANIGYTFMNYDVAGVKAVTFSAASTSARLNVKVQHSTDAGTTWSSGMVYTLSGTKTTFLYFISSTAVNVRLKFTIVVPSTAPSETANVRIDDVIFYSAGEALTIGGTAGAPAAGGDSGSGGDGGGSTEGVVATTGGWLLSAESYTPALLELPAFSANNSTQYCALHKILKSDGTYDSRRNYALLYDTQYNIPLWVAYPLHSSYNNTGTRTDKWQYDPAIPQSKQVNLSSSYGSYSRGHMLPSASRTSTSNHSNYQTFYYTNMTPQTSDHNGGIWNSIEIKVREWQGTGTDTLYVVTGVALKTVGGSESISYTTNKGDNKRVAVPNYYYKVLLYVATAANNTKSYKGVAIWTKHTDSGSFTSSYFKTIDQVEALTGIDYFANLPAATQTQFESSFTASDWPI